MTWTTVTITPLAFVFDLMDNQLDPEDRINLSEKILWVNWVNDGSWCLEIFFNFFQSDYSHLTFKSIALKYLKGAFVFDILATIPPMVTG